METNQPAQKRVTYGGKVFSFPAEYDNAQIGEFFQNFRQTDQFDQIIDKEAGAPAGVRAMVKRHDNALKQLEQLKRYYPDAEAYGDDNFIFTDGKTGRITLYNPEGLDVGDVAEYGREISEGAFGTLAATGAFIAGQAGPQMFMPEEAVTVPAAAAVGAEFGARAFDFFAEVFGAVPREQSLGEVFLESTVRMGTAATGEALGPAVSAGAKKLLGGGTQASKRLADKLMRLGIDPEASTVTEGTGVGRLRAALEQASTSANDIYEQADRVVEQTGKAAERLASRLGSVREKTAAGTALKEAAETATQEISERFSAEYDNIFFDIGSFSKVGELSSLADALTPYLDDLANLPPEVAPKGAMKELVEKYAAIAGMAADGALDFGQLRKFRTEILEIQRKTTMNTAGNYDSLVRKISTALTEDMSRVASEISPDASNALKALDGEYAVWKQGAAKTMQKIRDTDADIKAFEYILMSARSKSPEGVKALERLKSAFTDEEWGDVAASVLYDLGKETAGGGVDDVAGFSVGRFMTRVREIKEAGPEAWDALFGNTRFSELGDALDDLVEVAGKMKEIDQVRNRSQTAGALFQLAAMSALGATGYNFVQSGDPTALGYAAAGILAPKAAAKLLTSPKFVAWLAEPVTEGSKQISGRIGQLFAIATAEPYLQEEILQFSNSLRAVSGYDINAQEEQAQ